MRLGFLARFGMGKKRSVKAARATAPRTYRPRLHGLEDRLTPSTLHPVAFGPALIGPVHAAHDMDFVRSDDGRHALGSDDRGDERRSDDGRDELRSSHDMDKLRPVTVLPLKITNVVNQNGQLVAQGTLGGQSFTAPLTVTAQPTADPTTSILNLQLAPIHLDLLGLSVDTSPICLSITAQSGTENALGNVISNVAGALNSGTSLSTILSGLSSQQLSTLTSGLSSMLNSGLHDVTTPAVSTLRHDVTVPATHVLDLSLGPVDLNLLGLNVHLDNCSNGPVTVSITAQPGAGNLLGNLIGNLGNLLDSHAANRAIENALGRIARAVDSLIAMPPVSVPPLRITGVALQNGALVAEGTLGGIRFTDPVTVTASPNAADPTCPILNLQLAPIHLSVLGLNVDTSAICASVTAQSGNGNLFGNLLCDVANLLNNGASLGSVLSGLTGSQLQTLTHGVTSLLGGVLHDVTTPALNAIRQDVSVSNATGTNVLNLSLGPVDLNLLGLMVHLDNCANGPVTVSVTATPGAGNLLGNLISNLSHLLDSNASLTALETALGRIANDITSLA